MVDTGEQFLLIDELEVIFESAVHLFAQYTGARVSIEFVRVHERAHATRLARVIPCIRQEATEQIRLLASQQRVIADGIVKCQLAGRRHVFADEHIMGTFVFQQFGKLLVQIGCADGSHRVFRIHVGNGVGRLPLEFHPRRVADHEVEATVLEHVGEFELPVEEPLPFGDLPHQLQSPRWRSVAFTQLIKIHLVGVHVVAFMAFILNVHEHGWASFMSASPSSWIFPRKDQGHFIEVLCSVG